MAVFLLLLANIFSFHSKKFRNHDL